MLTRNIVKNINVLKKKCRLLEIDIFEITSEIIELEISRETLIGELKKHRKALYEEFEKMDSRRTL